MENKIICVVGLGYVGLPLAVKFAEAGFKTIGLDLNEKKVAELKTGYDSMNEVDSENLINSGIEISSDPSQISKANFIIVAVPTPIDKSRRPDISLLEKASEMVGKYLTPNSIVVFESTVYPGCTEEDCMPIIEDTSGLVCGNDWFIGYSPERVNPGDKNHTIDKIVKVTAGMNPKVSEEIAQVYGSIITAGIHKASSIKVAEAAKVIENTQRDINIGLMNELAMIFDLMDIPTSEVLEAAGTKWNFLKFTPGLVGGHCIGVDPYYLVHKAELHGHHPHIITAGRKINDDMPVWIASKVVKMLIEQGKSVKTSKLLILGLTFKENVNDMRNSKARELINELLEFGVECVACDPHLTQNEAMDEFGVNNVEINDLEPVFDGIIHVTAHNKFKEISTETLRNLCKDAPIFYDIRNGFDKEELKKLGFLNKNL